MIKLKSNTSELSIIEQLSLLDAKKRESILNELAPSKEERELLLYNYKFRARPKQILPLDKNYFNYLVLAGRGFGKTFLGSNHIINYAMREPCILGVASSTARDTRDVVVESGVSSIIAQCPPWYKGVYNPSKNLITFPNGSIVHTFSGEKPDGLRGFQFHKFWLDEFAKFRYPQEFYDQLMLCMRLPEGKPELILTTTPRPIKALKTILNDSTTYVVRGSTYDNRNNLSNAFLKQIENKYAGTRLGRQEIEGEVLSDLQGALWNYDLIDLNRVSTHPPLIETVIAIDPAVTSNNASNETGIIVVGKSEDGHGYVLEDCSGVYTPSQWAELVINLYDRYSANRIIAEVNNGGDLVETNLQTTARMQNRSPLPYKKVHASKGKFVRAEPISTIYEKNRVHHVGSFPFLEDQMTSFIPGAKSPDRMDALVWGLTHLLVTVDEVTFIKNNLW